MSAEPLQLPHLIEWAAAGEPPRWPSVAFLSSAQRLAQGLDTRGATGVTDEWFACLGDSGAETGTSTGERGPADEFYRDLLKWAPYFRSAEKDFHKLRNFYLRSGPITAFGAKYGYESLHAACLAIDWFDRLFNLSEAVEWEDSAALDSWCASAEKGPDGLPHFETTIPGVGCPELMTIAFRPVSATDALENEGAVNARGLAPSFTQAGRAVARAVVDHMARLRLAPVASTVGYYWGLQPRAAVDMAFITWLPWYWIKYDESVPKCAACGRPVAPGRRKWCSTRCRERLYKQRQRRRTQR